MSKKLFLLFSILGVSCGYGASFEELMGSPKALGQNLQTEEDRQAFSFYKNHYEKVLQKDNSMEQKSAIPKVLHFLWINPRPMSPRCISNIASWQKLHPDWKVLVWTTKTKQKLPFATSYVEDLPFSFLKKYFDLTSNYIEKQRLLGYEILFQQGGVVVDPQMPCLKSLETIASKGLDFFCSLTPLLPDPPSGSSINLSFMIIAAKPNHAIIKKCIEGIEHKWSEIGKAFPVDDKEAKLFRLVYRSEIPLEEAVKSDIGPRDCIFPANYFHDLPGRHAMFGQGPKKPCKVIGEISFDEKNELFINKMMKRQKIFFGFQAVLLAGLLCMIVRDLRTL